MAVEYPVALDSDYGVWRAFDNHYWPAALLRRRARDESGTTTSARAATKSGARHPAGCSAVDGDLVSVSPDGFEAQADWANLGSPETYLGYEQAQNFASPAGAAPATSSQPTPCRTG